MRFSTALLGSQSDMESHCVWDGLGKAYGAEGASEPSRSGVKRTATPVTRKRSDPHIYRHTNGEIDE